MTDLSGQPIGRYHLLLQLGEGGMATVYKAHDTRLERDVAIKLIRRSAFPAEVHDQILARFEREAKSLARLSHPNIVKVHDYGEYEGAPYLVLEYFAGGDLKQRLTGKPLDWRKALQLILPIARALEFSHQQGIIHRDVKPSNILFTISDEPMLSDFGIAKMLEYDETATLTGTGVGVGTPGYMAPEQWTGQTSPQSDQYGLGVVLYELLTGRKPYDADTPAGILIKQTSQPLPPPRQFIPTLPVSVEQALLKTLNKDPAERYPEMGELITALETLLTKSDVQTRNDPDATVDFIPLSTTHSITQTVVDKPAVPLHSSATNHRRRGWMIAILGTAAILIAIFLGTQPQIFKPRITPTTTVTTTLTPSDAASLAKIPTVAFTTTITMTVTATASPTFTLTSSPTPTSSATATPKLLACSWTEPQHPGYSGISTYACSCGETICFCRQGYRTGPNDTSIEWRTINRTYTLGEIQGYVGKYKGTCN